MTVKVVVLDTVGTGTWVVPADFTTNNQIHIIGGGGGGYTSVTLLTERGYSGGGGGYTSIKNWKYSGGMSVAYTIGSGGLCALSNGTSVTRESSDGGDTKFDAGAYGVYAAGGGKAGKVQTTTTPSPPVTGLGGLGNTGGAVPAGASAVSISSNGGYGYAGGSLGAGGAGGPNGNGKNGTATSSGAGDNGLGGAGVIGTDNRGDGWPGEEIYNDSTVAYGSGSGGLVDINIASLAPGNGGLYGGGGAFYTFGAKNNLTAYPAPSGAKGAIIIVYDDGTTKPGGYKCFDLTRSLSDYFMTTTELIDYYAQGAAWSWGNNTSGALGSNQATTGATLSSSVPVAVSGSNYTWKQCSVGGGNFAASIRVDGTLWTWGYNANGQLGNNSANNTTRSSPGTINGGGTWKKVSCGGTTTSAIKSDGSLWGWGSNAYGTIGDSTTTQRKIPTAVSGTNTWKSVSCSVVNGSSAHVAAIDINGEAWGWGINTYGQIGDNSTTDYSSPVKVYGNYTNWTQVSCGTAFTLGLQSDGTLWGWGVGTNGQLGLNSSQAKTAPTKLVGNNWKLIAAGGFHAAGIKTDGSLWTWGNNTYRQLGVAAAPQSNVPVQVPGNDWKYVTCGGYITIGIKTDGTLWLWGTNTAGMANADPTTVTFVATPTQITTAGFNWKQVAIGGSTVVAVQYSDIGQIL